MFDFYITRINVLPTCKYLTHELGKPDTFFLAGKSKSGHEMVLIWGGKG